MSYLEVNNFKFGLDTRKSEMTANPGALVIAQDGVINEGGEFEKRKVFGAYTLPAAPGDPTTYGIVATSTGFTVFGSGADTNNAYPYSLWISGPVVDYQQLSFNSEAMAKLVMATSFGGKVLAIARFATKTVAFYDGTIIADFIAGLVLSSMVVNNNTTAGDQADTREAIAAAFSALPQAPYVGTLYAGLPYFEITGPVDIGAYSLQLEETTAGSGTVSSAIQSEATAGGLATAPIAQFEVVYGMTGGQVTNIVITNGVSPDDILGAAVSWTTNTELTATAIATGINAATALYTAAASGSIVKITRVAKGDDQNGFHCVVTASGPMCIGRCSFGLAGSEFVLESIAANGVELLPTDVTYPTGETTYTSINDLLVDATYGLVTKINAGTGTHGYVASAVSNILFVSKAVTSSADPTEEVYVVCTGGQVTEGVLAPLTALATPSGVGVEGYDATRNIDYTFAISCIATGGSPPYTYQWRQTRQEIIFQEKYSQVLGPTAASSSAATTAFQRYSYHHDPFAYRTWWVCDVRDAAGTRVSSNEVSAYVSYLR